MLEVPWEQEASELFWSRESFWRAGKISEAFWTPQLQSPAVYSQGL